MLTTLKRGLRRMIHGTRPPASSSLADIGVSGRYAPDAPSPAAIASIFQGRWLSKLPAEIGFPGGAVELFNDPRMDQVAEAFTLRGKSVLELGPLEAGHTTQLLRAGAESVTAVEGNSLSFLKCLAVKEALGLTNAQFLFGDFVAYLRERRRDFDIGIACGVLYHMRNPVELIELLAHACREGVYVWTHYYDPSFRLRNPGEAAHLKESRTGSWKGFRHTAVRYDYEQALDSDTFCGGPAPSSAWLPRADLLAAFESFGLGQIEILADDLEHPHGPCISFIAKR